MNHEKLGEMWERAKMNHMNLVILARRPDALSQGLPQDIAGYVIGRGSMYSVFDPDTREYIEDVRPEWIYAANLVKPRPVQDM